MIHKMGQEGETNLKEPIRLESFSDMDLKNSLKDKKTAELHANVLKNGKKFIYELWQAKFHLMALSSFWGVVHSEVDPLICPSCTIIRREKRPW